MSLFDSVGVVHQALDYHLARQNLLTANLAHVDTPGYRAQELYRDRPFAGVLQTEMRATDSRHLGGTPMPADWRVKADPHAAVGPDGNSVNLDREAVKVASNNLRYEAITSITAGRLESLLWAARDAH